MWQGLPLAKKCLLLFGGAIVLIISAALVAPWFRMGYLVDTGQLAVSRQAVETWAQLDAAEAEGVSPETALPGPARRDNWRTVIPVTRIRIESISDTNDPEGFARRAATYLREHPDQPDYQEARWRGTSREFMYAKAERSKMSETGRLAALLVLDRRSIEATRLLLLNSAFLLGSGLVVLALALLAFYLVAQSLILRPVRLLKTTAERVREGNLAIRSDLRTGDEFEELAETFNQMLADLQSSQDRLRAINVAMDTKLHELAESNLSLFNAAKHKGEFLANVSHELRTPLNSILGFAELLLEQARADAAQTDPEPAPSVFKRIRYLENIQAAGKGLLSLINSLLEMARIEAGRVELHVERVNLRDVCSGLLGLIAPLAQKKGVQLSMEVPDDVPLIESDAKKIQQIVFNFLSNAVKFVEGEEKTGRVSTVTLRVERLVASASEGDPRVRVSVIDNGPGIPKEDLDRIFEKFYQRDGGHTREHTGTGLGLAISRELATLLQGEIQVVSEVGRGSMFSLILPTKFREAEAAPALASPA